MFRSMTRSIATATVLGALMLPIVTPLALEKTAGSDNSDLKGIEVATELKMETIRAIVEAAINAVIARISNLEGRVAGLEVTTANLEARMTQAEADIALLKTQVAALQATDASLQAQLNAFSVRMANAEANIAALWVYYNQLKERVDAQDVQLTQLHARITALESGLASVSARISALEVNAGNWNWMFGPWRSWAEGAFTAINAVIADLNTRLIALTGRVTALESKTVTWSYGSCYETSFGAWQSWGECQAGYVVRGSLLGGVPGCNSGYTCARIYMRCCQMNVTYQ